MRKFLLYLTAFKFKSSQSFKYIASSIIHTDSKFVSPARQAMEDSSSYTGNLIIRPDTEGIKMAGNLIRSGSLVAFPTETVYGLGANALNEDAVLSIFVAKGRPLTDPLIVHVVDKAQALELVEIDGEERVLFEAMADAFWPGPLTLIARAGISIPRAVTANTGYVGIRAPAHPIAIALLNESGVPIAAPSANRFAHVSPTRAEHVIADLGDKGVMVIDGDTDTQSACEHGIESTIVKIDKNAQQLVILRQGAITKTDVEAVLRRIGLFSPWTVDVMVRAVKMAARGNADARDNNDDSSNNNNDRSALVNDRNDNDENVVGEVAPGQAMTHYSPDVPCVLVSSFAFDRANPISTDGNIGASVRADSRLAVVCDTSGELVLTTQELRDSVVIDFAGQLHGLQSSSSIFTSSLSSSSSSLGDDIAVRGYRDLSAGGDAAEAARNLFALLRWAEGVEGCRRVLLASVKSAENEALLRDGCASSGEVFEADLAATRGGERSATSYRLVYGLSDRMFRAASGVSVHLKILCTD